MREHIWILSYQKNVGINDSWVFPEGTACASFDFWVPCAVLRDPLWAVKKKTMSKATKTAMRLLANTHGWKSVQLSASGHTRIGG